MKIKELEQNIVFETSEKIVAKYAGFKKLITELNKKEIPSKTADLINQKIEEINSFKGSDKDLLKIFRTSQTEILKLIEKELKLVVKNHFRTMWMILGMAAFGIPLGVVFGISLGNMAFLGIGLPMGMGIGIAVGTAMDKKAYEKGNQLDVEMKY